MFPSSEVVDIPFESHSTVMVVAVDGTGKKHHLGLKDVLYNFRYLCQANGTVTRVNRPAAKHIAFYVSGGPKAIVYYATVENIVEDNDQRCYYLDSISKLKDPIPLGKIPPNFSGGAVHLSIRNFMRLNNTDEIYQHLIPRR